MAEPPARAGSIGMSSTLLKGVPCSLAASRSKSALLGKGRPRMVEVVDVGLKGGDGAARPLVDEDSESTLP